MIISFLIASLLIIFMHRQYVREQFWEVGSHISILHKIFPINMPWALSVTIDSASPDQEYMFILVSPFSWSSSISPDQEYIYWSPPSPGIQSPQLIKNKVSSNFTFIYFKWMVSILHSKLQHNIQNCKVICHEDKKPVSQFPTIIQCSELRLKCTGCM